MAMLLPQLLAWITRCWGFCWSVATMYWPEAIAGLYPLLRYGETMAIEVLAFGAGMDERFWALRRLPSQVLFSRKA